MPAVSQAQQEIAAIALHGHPKPGTAAAKMKKSMSKKELHKFASTKRKDLPKHVKEDFKAMTFKQFLQLDEEWEQEYHTPENKRGMWDGWTKAELEAELNRLRKSGPHEEGSPEYTKEKELIFAIRAKSGWPKGSMK